MPETDTFRGSCFCGQIAYTVSGPLRPVNWCHCSLCRKRFGGAGSAMSPVGPGQFEWAQGESLLTRFGEDYGLGFCSVCGSMLVGFKGDAVLGIALSCLDDDPPVEIAQHVFVGSKARWDVIGDDAPRHHEWPT